MRQFYSVLEKYFSRISYFVQTKDSSMTGGEETYFGHQPRNQAVKYLPLDRHQVVIIGPPEHFDKIKSEISKIVWTLSAEVYPNL